MGEEGVKNNTSYFLSLVCISDTLSQLRLIINAM